MTPLHVKVGCVILKYDWPQTLHSVPSPELLIHTWHAPPGALWDSLKVLHSRRARTAVPSCSTTDAQKTEPWGSLLKSNTWSKNDFRPIQGQTYGKEIMQTEVEDSGA